MKPESIRGEKPAITVLALMIMLLPIVAMDVLVDSSYDNPFLIWILKHQIYWIVKSTPTPIMIDESRAVAASRAIPANPMNPNRIIIEIASGIDPIRPPFTDLNIMAEEHKNGDQGKQ